MIRLDYPSGVLSSSLWVGTSLDPADYIDRELDPETAHSHALGFETQHRLGARLAAWLESRA